MDLQQLIDREQIRQVLIDYTQAVDSGRFEELRDVFTPDAVLDYSSAGGPAAASVPEALEFLENLRGFERWQHVLGQTRIEFAGPDEAHTKTWFINPMVAKRRDGTEHVVQVGGYYHHTMQRVGHHDEQVWRSRHFVDELIWNC